MGCERWCWIIYDGHTWFVVSIMAAYRICLGQQSIERIPKKIVDLDTGDSKFKGKYLNVAESLSVKSKWRELELICCR